MLALALTGVPALASPPGSGESGAGESGAVEGPSEPASESGAVEGPSEPAPSLEPPPPSIEFQPQPQPQEEGLTMPPAGSTTPAPMSRRDEIGKAPASGGAFIAGGAWLLPAAGLGTWGMVLLNRQTQYPPYSSEPYIITAGAGIGVIGAAMLGMGIYRWVQLRRWATRHRVIALPQGSALTTSGTLAGLFGVGVLITAIQGRNGVVGAVSGAMLVSSPIQIAVGVRQARRYQRTGGWRATQYTLVPGGLEFRF